MNSFLFNIHVVFPTLGKAYPDTHQTKFSFTNSGKNSPHSGYRYYISTADISVLVLHPTSVQIGLVVLVNLRGVLLTANSAQYCYQKHLWAVPSAGCYSNPY